MKLSEQLKQDNDCGDFGKALEGYSERAARLEDALEKMCETYGDIAFKAGDRSLRESDWFSGDAVLSEARQVIRGNA